LLANLLQKKTTQRSGANVPQVFKNIFRRKTGKNTGYFTSNGCFFQDKNDHNIVFIFRQKMSETLSLFAQNRYIPQVYEKRTLFLFERNLKEA
jgi:hypothetical protein